MYLKLIRNKANGSAITGRLIIDGRWFCNTLERKGYEIPALCYHLAVTQSPRFKRLLPIVQNVPQRSGIRFHRGSKPEHSTGCVLVVADNNNNLNNINQQLLRSQQHSERSKEYNSSPLGCVLISPKGSNDRSAYVPQRNVVNNKIPVGCRSAADVERELTGLILKAQQEHEEIILEVSDFRPGTDYGYDTPCPSSECASEKEIRAANFARRHPSSILEPTRLSDDC